MGSSSSAPKYNQQASLAEQNRINKVAGFQQYANVNSPLGGYTTSVDPETGQITINKNLSEASKLAQLNQMGALSNYNSNPTEAADAYYNAQMAYLQPQLDRQIERTESSLTNRGLPLGSSAWNSAMGDVYDAQNRTLTALSNEALANGQQYQTNILNQAGMLGSQVIDPTMISGQAGAGMENAYDQQFASQIESWKQKQANKNALTSGLLGAAGNIVGGAAAGGTYALAASDKRLKTDLRLVGKSDNGLNIYLGRYTKESGLDDGKEHLFIIAQEVKDIVPEAVVEGEDGFLKVNYAKALGVEHGKEQ